MIQFTRALATDLDEAARLDGCNPWQVFRHIIVPLLNDVVLYTVPLGLRQFLDARGDSSRGPMLAMSTVALLPPPVVFITFQPQVVDGITTTGLRG